MILLSKKRHKSPAPFIALSLTAMVLSSFAVHPARAGWMDWAEAHAREQKLSELKEYYVHLNDVDGLSNWRLVATENLHLVLTWQTPPTAYREELQRAALVGSRETNAEFIVVSLQTAANAEAKPNLLCKVTAARAAITKWEGSNCGQEKIEFE